MESTSCELQRYQELSHRDHTLKMHGSETTKNEAVRVFPCVPRASLLDSSLTTKGQGQFHLEQVLDQCLVREESFRPGNLCTGKPRKNDA